MQSLVGFSLIALVAVALVNETVAVSNRRSYQIQRTDIKDTREALSLMQRFLSHTLSPEQRCEYYAVLLHKLSTSRVDQFSIVEFGLSSSESVHNIFLGLGIETLRNLFMDGISKYFKSQVDKPMLELVDCLSSKFRTSDAKARSFLNNKELQESIDQYKSIVNQPLEFMLDPQAVHPQLTLGQLTPMVRSAVNNLFNGDQSKVTAKFGSNVGNAKAATPELPSPPIEARRTPDDSSPANLLPQTRPTPSSANQPAAPTPGAQQASAPIVATQAEVQAATGAQDSSDPKADLSALTPEELEHLAKVSASFDFLYQSLPEQSALADRCLAYSKVTETNLAPLSEETVEQIAKETSEHVTTSGPTEGEFMPDQSTRENYFLTLVNMDPKQVDSDTYFDLIDCMLPWAQENEAIGAFLKSPELVKVLSEL